MTPGRRRFGRRALLAGAGAGAAGALIGISVLTDDDHSSVPTPGPSPSPTLPPTTPSQGSPAAVDLAVRWRVLQRRVDDPDLLAGWHFDETSGYAFDDVSGHGHVLYLTGLRWNTTESGLASAVHRRGLRGSAVHLDGGRWLAAAPTTTLTTPAGLSISTRLRADVLPGNGALLVGLGTIANLTLDGAGQLALTVGTRSGSERVVRSAPHAVTPGEWVHVSGTLDPRGGVIRLYVDGEPSGVVRGAPFVPVSGPATLLVGSGLRGDLDELAMHRVALDPPAVRRLALLGLPTVFTQSSESIDPGLEVFTRFKGSDPVPHPVVQGTALSLRFAGSATSEQGADPLTAPPTGLTATAPPMFVPGVFGGAWRAANRRLTYASPLTGDDGTFEAWYRAIEDPQDPGRRHRKELFVAAGAGCGLTLFSQGGRWQVEVRRSAGRQDTLAAPAQVLTPGTLEHVAVTWGEQAGGDQGVVLYVNGVPAGRLATAAGETSYGLRVGVGGTSAAPSYVLLDDVRISDSALPWGEVCPRGQAAAGAAGLDLRDSFDRPPAAAPMLWRPGSGGATWSHRRMTWQDPEAVGADPASVRALFQEAPTGVHAVYHPDAFGYGSSIEAGVACPTRTDGWAGIFVQAPLPGGPFTGLTFMVNSQRSQLRLARFADGRAVDAKVLPHDFPMAAETTYELTLTNNGDGIVRGFVDGINVISMRVGADWPDRGYAGLATVDSQAFFSHLHFSALTSARLDSRVIHTRVIRYGEGADVGALHLVPFQWHKRRGLLPWQYTSKDPEPPGNIAGADTTLPLRPISPATWRSEDSANPDVIVVAGRVLCFLRGNPRINGRPAPARVGVLHTSTAQFDGQHFTDPNAQTGLLHGGAILVSGGPLNATKPTEPGSLQLNEPSTAYVGGGRLLFFGRESTAPEPGGVRYGRLAYSRYDVRTDSWEHAVAQHVPWSQLGVLSSTAPPVDQRHLHGTPEIVSLRNPDDDAFQVVIFQQTGRTGAAVMATALLDDVSSGLPTPAAGATVETSLSRPSGGAIYGFRVLFDNGIYYLHYNEGDQVPDWPSRFVLAAALDPYAGPWVANPDAADPASTYFRRGAPFEPDNAAIWQGTMVKHRGCYYLYYENFHAIHDVDDAYADYANPQVGSRLGFATA